MGNDSCPCCGKTCDAVTAIEEGTKPKVGDITICFYCAAYLQFGSDFALEALPADDYDVLPQEIKDTLWNARKHILSRP